MPGFTGSESYSNANKGPTAKDARTAGASLYGKNHRQKPPVHTHGTFNPAKATENITAERTVKRSDVI